MGNCLVLEERVVKVVRTDGKVLEYRAPIRAHQVLREFSGHELLNAPGDPRQLQPDDKLLGGSVYYLVALSPPSPETKKKKVRFASPEVEGTQGTNVVRIKLVVSKRELKMLLQGGSLEEVVTRGINKGSSEGIAAAEGCGGWKPELESIPEMD